MRGMTATNIGKTENIDELNRLVGYYQKTKLWGGELERERMENKKQL